MYHYPCAGNRRNHDARTIYFRSPDTGHGLRKKYRWIPIGTYCSDCGRIALMKEFAPIEETVAANEDS